MKKKKKSLYKKIMRELRANISTVFQIVTIGMLLRLIFKN